MTSSHPQAEEKLKRAVRLARRSRLARLASEPWRLIYPRILRAFGLSRRSSAETFWGGAFDALLPEAVSTHIWRYGFFEEDVCLFMLRSLESGLVFVDVGAHFGFFTLLGSGLVGGQGRALALEPMPKTYTLLTGNVSRNAIFDNIITMNSAAYSANTTLNFHDYGLINAGLDSAFPPRNQGGSTSGSQETVVDARRLDDLLTALELPRIDLLKIDAESSEMHVLRGAEAVINEFRPRIILEVGDFDLPDVARSAELVEWLRMRGYVAHDYINGSITPHQNRDRYAYGNLLFIHSTESEQAQTR